MREAPVGVDRSVARFATDLLAAYRRAPLPSPSVSERLAAGSRRVLVFLHAARNAAITHERVARHGARRRGFSVHSYWSVLLAHLGEEAKSRIVTLRRRSATERRLVGAFVLSLVLVASVIGEAGPGDSVGAVADGGVGTPGRVAALDGSFGSPASYRALGALERDDEIDPGVAFDAAVAEAAPGGPYLPDGTLLKPVAIEATFPGLERDDVTIYKVRSGDTLTGIAARFKVSMMTLWWANKLTTKDSLKVGQEIVVPPVSGLLWTVKEGNTLASIAKETKADVDAIRTFNGLTSDTLILGQELMIPGGKGEPIPTPKPSPRPVYRSSSSGGCSGCSFSGTLRWPVPAGGYISQYYSAYHRAIDIAAPYGSSVVASAYGRVVWAGWRSNCGGYQIWVDHGNGTFTGYYHLSAILVGAGRYVGRGQQIGRIGSSGCTTGPHLHFEVRRGSRYDTATRVNPLYYL